MATTKTQPVKTQSLTLGEIKVLENLPVIQTSGFTVNQPIESPFIFFAHPLSKQAWSMLTNHIPKPQEQYPYLIEQNAACFCHPLFITPISITQCWVQEDGQGRPLAFSPDCPENRFDWKECIETILVVYLENRVLLARGSFKGPKAQGWQTVLKTMQEMEENIEGWLAISPEHKLTQKIADNRFKMVVELSCNDRTGKETGLAYTATQSRIYPMKPNFLNPLTALLQSGEFQSQLEPCVRGLNRRMEDLRKAGK